MRPIILSTALLAGMAAHAQQIDGYRYWFDDVVAGAVTTAVAPTGELVLSTMLPTGTMAAGHHRMSVQFRDTDGNWSSPHTTVFTRSGTTVSGYRYWLNDDPGTLTAGTIAPEATVDLNSMLSAGTTRAFNLFTIQFHDDDGLYSAPVTKAFTRGTGVVDGYEHWIDDAIEDRTTNGIGPAGVVDLIADLPTPTTEGDHLFTIRFRSENGAWSVPLSSTFSFVVGIDELPGVHDLLLFPNPATDQLSLRLNSEGSRALRLEVLDMQGRRVLDLDQWSVSGSASRSWDISGLPSASYLLRITDARGAWSTRFVKH